MANTEGIQIYHINNITFIATPETVFVKTKLQMFYLEPQTSYWNRRVQFIKTMIAIDEIRSLNELASFCAGGKVMWVSTRPEYHKSMLELAYGKG